MESFQEVSNPVLQFLKTHPLFSPFSFNEKIALSANISIRRYKHREIIYSPIKEHTPIFYVIDGGLILSYKPHYEQSKALNIDILGPKDFFFANKLLSQNIQSVVTVQSIFNSTVFAFNEESALRLIRKFPMNNNYVNYVLARKLDRLYPCSYNLALHTIPQKIAHILLIFYSKFSILTTQDSGLISIQIPHSVIAEFFNTSRENVTKVIKSFMGLKLISYVKNRLIFIPSLQKLKEFSECRRK